MIPQQLKGLGLGFLALRKKRKEPIHSGYQNDPLSEERAIEYISDGFNYGVICGLGDIVVIDTDSEYLEKKAAEQLPATFTVKTDKGFHRYYKSNIPTKRRKSLNHEGSQVGDFMGGACYVVAPGSIHPDTGEEYEVVNDDEVLEIAPEFLLKFIEPYVRAEREPIAKEYCSEGDEISIAKVVSASGMKMKRRGNELIGEHPLHGSTTGTNLSINLEKNVWRCFRCDSGGGAMSLIAVLEGIIDCDQAIPGGLKGDAFRQTVAIAREKYGMEINIPERVSKMEGNKIMVNGVPKTITDMDSLNKRFAQLEAPQSPCVVVDRIGAMPITTADYSARLSGEVVVTGEKGNGDMKTMPASSYWRGNTEKHIFNNIVFSNKDVKDTDFNLFSGFGVRPVEGSCERIIEHVKTVICNGNDNDFESIIKLLAWQVQNIGEPSRVITVLKSQQQQTGKGAFLEGVLGKMYGSSGLITSDMGKVLGRFNDAIRGKSYIFLDEALFGGDKKSADSVKALSTTKIASIEAKGMPVVQTPSGVNLFLASNHSNAAHIESGDSRYWILDVSDEKSGDHKYFESLYKEINSGGVAAFLGLLLETDCSGFFPSRDIDRCNSSREEMIHSSYNPYDARFWLERCCDLGVIVGMKPRDAYCSGNVLWREGDQYSNSELYDSYVEWQKTVRTKTAPDTTCARSLGGLYTQFGFVGYNSNKGRVRKLPSIESFESRLFDKE